MFDIYYIDRNQITEMCFILSIRHYFNLPILKRWVVNVMKVFYKYL